MEFDIEKIISNLANNYYPLFVSERHLQVSFIIEANKCYQNYSFIPEYVFNDHGKTLHIDLMISDGNEYIAVEFKYIVAGGKINVPGDKNYKLRNQSAVVNRRHQCVMDICRLEKYVSSNKIKCTKGYFVLITNMSAFWKGSKSESTSSEFDIKDKSILHKGVHSPIGETKFAKEKEKIELKNDYKIKYKDYKKIDGKSGLFKYLLVEVEK